MVDVAGSAGSSEGADASPPGAASDKELDEEVEFLLASSDKGESGDAEVTTQASANVTGSLSALRTTQAQQRRRQKRKVPPFPDAEAAKAS